MAVLIFLIVIEINVQAELSKCIGDVLIVICGFRGLVGVLGPADAFCQVGGCRRDRGDG